MRWIWGALAAMSTVAMLGGCASYVTVPDNESSIRFQKVNTPPVPTVMAGALGYAATRYPVPGPFAVELPRGAGDHTQSIVRERSGAQEVVLAGEPTSLPTYRIVEVRVRGDDAFVDVLLPVDAGEDRRLLEVRLDGGMTGWRFVAAKPSYAPAALLVEPHPVVPPPAVAPAPADTPPASSPPPTEAPEGNYPPGVREITGQSHRPAASQDHVRTGAASPARAPESGDEEDRPLVPVRPVESGGE